MFKSLVSLLVAIALLASCSPTQENEQVPDQQIMMQYTEEIKSPYRRVLNFSPFQPGLSAERERQLNAIVLSNSFIAVQKSIAENKLTVEELLLYYVERIKRFNPSVNAVLELNPSAMEQAKAMDLALAKGENPGSLYGAIVLVKDNIAVKTLHTATGSYALRNLTTTRDAFVVTKLKEAGAIILGKTNLSEWSNLMSYPSSNGFSVLGGQTKNPYGAFDVGGSSSGSSVSASLHFASFTLGSETSGSLIYPAGQNSVVALKATLATISRDLIVPISEALDTAGVIATNVSDLQLAHNAIIAYDPNDHFAQENLIVEMKQKSQHLKLDKNALRGKRLGLYDDGSEEITAIARDFTKAGAEVIPVSIDRDSIPADLFLPILSYGIVNDVQAFLTRAEVNSSIKSLEEVVNFNQEDPESRAPYGWQYHEHALSNQPTKEEYQESLAKLRTASRRALDLALSSDKLDAIISISNQMSLLYASAGYPALTVPSGYGKTGEPYGVTLVGKAYSDIDLIKFAYAYEQATRYRKNPVTPLWMDASE